MQHTTLCFLVKEKEILLAIKKRGHGEGKWNGVGGKLDLGETPVDAAKREAQEEIGVTPLELEKVGEITSFSPNVPIEKRFDQIIHVFLCRSWEGEPTESEEMLPKWYSQDELPFQKMWPDDPFWLPLVLAGKKVKGDFSFDETDEITSHQVVTMNEFSDFQTKLD
jgi:mutator protein MutT